MLHSFIVSSSYLLDNSLQKNCSTDWLGQNPAALTENQNFTKKKTKKKTGKVELCTVFPNSHFF